MEWIPVRDVLNEQQRSSCSEGELNSTVYFHEPGTDQEPQLFEVKFPPDTVVHVHAHLRDEIIDVLGGEMLAGNRSLLPGSTVFVAAETLYGFTAGRDGLTILNFRAVADKSLLTPEQHKALRSSAAHTAAVGPN